MLLVGHQHSSIGKLDLVARAVNHHVGSGNNPRRLAVVVDQQIADSNVTHRGPATGRREGSIEGKRLAHTRTGRDDNHLTSVKTVGDLVVSRADVEVVGLELRFKTNDSSAPARVIL